MKCKLIFILTLLVTILRAYEVKSINFNSSSQSISNSSFPTNTSNIDALIDLKGVEDNDTITVFWISRDRLSNIDNILAKTSQILNPSTKKINFTYRINDSLPKGDYAIEVFENSKKLAQKEFKLYSKDKIEPSKTSKKSTTNLLDISKISLATGVKRDLYGKITLIGEGNHFKNEQHTIYAIIYFENIKEDTPFSIEWVFLGDGYIQNRTIYKSIGKIHYINGSRKGVYVANITFPEDWRSGTYQFIFKVKGNIVSRKKFTIGDVQKSPKNQVIESSLQKKLIKELASWMLETIKLRDIRPLYEHSLHGWRDRHNWKRVKKGFEAIFNSGLKWKEIFMQNPKLRPIEYLGNGAIRLQAIYPGIDSVDILLEGTFFKEGNEWRLFGFALEPLDNQ